MKRVFFVTIAIVMALAGCQPVLPAATPTLPPLLTLATDAQAMTPTPDAPQPLPTTEPIPSPAPNPVEKVAIPQVNTIHQRTNEETFDKSKALYT